MKNNKNLEYYLGLDIGTDSVGYAATTPKYDLVKYHGEPAWGVMTFEAANQASARRKFRTARRRLDRRQQRVKLLEEIFAQEICKIDPQFFNRRRESSLFRKPTQESFCLFSDDDYTDMEYSRQYPTIHHLIVDLMNSDKPHDIRLVFHACAWLVAHRGHFLFDIPVERAAELLDFNAVYQQFCTYMEDEGYELPWGMNVPAEKVLSVLQMKCGVKAKEQEFYQKVLDGSKPEEDQNAQYSKKAVIGLLCGRKIKPAEIFQNDEYEGLDAIFLTMDDEQFAAALANLGEEGDMLRNLRALIDCAMLITASHGKMISEAKVDVYNQHKQDLAWLKYFVKKYMSQQYNQIFRRADEGNYVAYSGNVKSCDSPEKVKKAKKEAFSEYLKKKVKNVQVEEADLEKYQDMMARLESGSFLPKQRDGDNRVIPQQLYCIELERLLERASAYLPMLDQKDQSGFTAREKILAIFGFKIPYFVGPLGRVGENVWAVRKDGKIYPWNFSEMVDLDESETRFIRRMTNRCTYLPSEDVLPMASLLYSRYMVLNEINPIKVNSVPISVEDKQGIYTDLFMTRKKVSRKQIEDWLKSRGHFRKGDELSGIDKFAKASLCSYQSFSRFLQAGILSEADVEAIILHASCTEDRARMKKWLAENYPNLSAEDREYVAKLRLKGFGRLSEKLLAGIYDDRKDGTGEARNIIETMWETNETLMQLLSERYQYRSIVDELAMEFYGGSKKSLSEQLEEMYVSAAVRRPIIRALEITEDVVKSLGSAPKKIFVEMARGGTPDQKGKRTKTRKEQLLELYKKIKTEDARLLAKELEAMGDTADNRLQSDRLFLYYLQMGKSIYSGTPIDLSRLSSGDYNVDHIYPQSLVKDDSILNNRALALSTENKTKDDGLVPAAWQAKMRGYWEYLRDHKLMTDEKFRRLTRTAPFTDDEKLGFINRQLVEARQSSKVVAALLKERYPDTEIVYVKAGLVTEFRQEFELVKCRTLNDLHHAKDAYLNVVVGNVYHERFSKRWFNLDQQYNIQVKKIFDSQLPSWMDSVWKSQEDLPRVKKIVARNTAHVTRYSLCKKSGQSGGLFDQNPLRAESGLIPRKEDLPPEIYGGYSGATTTCFLLAKYQTGKKHEAMFVPVELRNAKQAFSSKEAAREYVEQTLIRQSKKPVTHVELLLGGRPLKINTCIDLDGFRVALSSGSLKDGRVGLTTLTPFKADPKIEQYIKRLESYDQKHTKNPNLSVSEEHDKLTMEGNIELYNLYIEKLANSIYAKRPGAMGALKKLQDGLSTFQNLTIDEQVQVLLKIHQLFARQSTGVDLSLIGGGKADCKARKSLSLSGWKEYTAVRIVDTSPAGLHETVSENLLELL